MRLRRPRSWWPIFLLVLVAIWIMILVVLIHRGPRLPSQPSAATAPTPVAVMPH